MFQISPSLKGDLADKLKVDSSNIIYLDNVDANLKAAQGMGMTTVKVPFKIFLPNSRLVLKLPVI